MFNKTLLLGWCSGGTIPEFGTRDMISQHMSKLEHIPPQGSPAQQVNKLTERNPVVDQKIISQRKTSVKKYATKTLKNLGKKHENKT